MKRVITSVRDTLLNRDKSSKHLGVHRLRVTEFSQRSLIDAAVERDEVRRLSWRAADHFKYILTIRFSRQSEQDLSLSSSFRCRPCIDEFVEGFSSIFNRSSEICRAYAVRMQRGKINYPIDALLPRNSVNARGRPRVSLLPVKYLRSILSLCLGVSSVGSCRSAKSSVPGLES